MDSGLSYRDLRDWLRKVEEAGQLVKIEGADWKTDIGLATEVLRSYKDAPAGLFDRIEGYPPGYRVLVNAFGDFWRIAFTLGLPLSRDVRELLQLWRNKVKTLEPLSPKYVDDGPVMENVHMGDEVNILEFPAPIWHELDGGRYIGTGSMSITKDPDSNWVNLGTYRVMVHDEKHVGFYISPGKHGRIHRDKYFSRGQPCPAVVVCGEHPLLFAASGAEVPYGLSEYDWAGGVRGEPFEVIRGRITGLPIPADAEIALEGYAHPGDMRMEGPFGEFTGYYASSARPEPVMEVKAVYHRDDPIIIGRPPGKPPFEDAKMDAFMKSALLWDYLEKAGVPDVTGVWGHLAGAVRMLWSVSIKQRYPGHARQAGHVAAQCHGGAYLGRYVVVVDDDIDVTNLDEVIWAVCTRSDPERSIDIIRRAWSGPLDPALPPGEKHFNSRAVIDACRPFEWRNNFPLVCASSPDRFKEGMAKWSKALFPDRP